MMTSSIQPEGNKNRREIKNDEYLLPILGDDDVIITSCLRVLGQCVEWGLVFGGYRLLCRPREADHSAARSAPTDQTLFQAFSLLKNQ